jgi:hypothetical protein
MSLTYSENTVKNITEQLIIISNLKAEQKLRISDCKNKCQIQDAWIWPIQGIIRWNDKRQDTIDFLEALYNRAVGECKQFTSSEALLIVGLRGKTYMTTLENTNYLHNKELLERLCLRIENSIVGLESLKTTYPNDPCYLSLIDKSQHIVKLTKLFLADSEANYKKMRLLSSPFEIIEDSVEEKKSSSSSLVSPNIPVPPPVWNSKHSLLKNGI